MKANRWAMAGWRAEELSLVGQGMGRNRRQALQWKEHWVRYPKRRVLAPHPQVPGAALRVPWHHTHKSPCKGESPLQRTTLLTHRISWALWAYELKCAVQRSSIRNRKWTLFHSRFLGYATPQVGLQFVALAILILSLSVCPWKGSAMTDKNWRGLYRETEPRPGRAKDLVPEGSETMSAEKLHRPRAGCSPRPSLLEWVFPGCMEQDWGDVEKVRAFSGLWSNYLWPLSECVTWHWRP